MMLLGVNLEEENTCNEISKEKIEILGPKSKYPNFHISMLFVVFFMMSYSISAIWLLFDGWLNDFSSIYWIWNICEISTIFKLALISMIGSILGCSTLDLLSFHKYVAIKKTYDLDHIWGFLFSPVLSAIIGLLVFALFQSGLLVLTGNFSNEKTPETAELAFAAIGFLSGYSWHHVIGKVRDISEDMFKNKKTQNSKFSSENLNNDSNNLSSEEEKKNNE